MRTKLKIPQKKFVDLWKQLEIFDLDGHKSFANDLTKAVIASIMDFIKINLRPPVISHGDLGGGNRTGLHSS
jgi:hypothetical protein